MKNILAENLLRFGAKGVNKETLKSYLLEQTKVAPDVYNKYIATSSIANLSSIINTYDPTKGAIKITDGNPWLATQRAKSLQQFLIQRFQGQFKIPFNESSATIIKTAVPGPGDENQYMKATIKAKLRKPPRQQTPYAYDILYNFYDIDGVPHIVVTKRGLGSPETLGSDNLAIQRFSSQEALKVPGSKLVKQSTGGGNTQGPSQFTYGIMIPITTGFAAKKKGRLYFNDIKQYIAMKDFIAKYTDLADATGKPKETGDLQGKTNLQTNFTSEKGGGGNYIFGDLGSGRSAVILAGSGKGTTITIKRMEPSKIGNLPGEILPGDEEKWMPIAEILYPGLFPDNLITIKPDMYNEIFSKIQETINELKANGYEAIEMTAEIQGFASTDNANNRCPKGFTPDHTWGGPVTADKWITL